MEISGLTRDIGEVNPRSRKLDVDGRILGPSGEWWMFDELKHVELFAIAMFVNCTKNFLLMWRNTYVRESKINTIETVVFPKKVLLKPPHTKSLTYFLSFPFQVVRRWSQVKKEYQA